MTSKFTIRDFLVYSFVGLSAGILIYIHETEKAKEFIKSLYAFSSFAVLIFVPISYLIGHLIMGIDDIIFNRILTFPIRNVNKKKSNKAWKVYNFVLFGYRNQGLKWSEHISKSDFLKKCDKLIEKGLYEKAEYYQVLSDLFKGIVLCLITSTIYRITKCEINYWELLALFIFWYRARMFSSYYVRIVKRSAE